MHGPPDRNPRSGKPSQVLSRAALGVALTCWLALPSHLTSADELLDAFAIQGEAATPDELLLWRLVEERRYVKAREDAEKFLAEHPDSFVAELSLGLAHHYGEANFPKSLFHCQRSIELFEREYGKLPGTEQPWRWHARMLQELASVHGDLEHYDEQLAAMARYNERYRPEFKAERAWPLMKLRRFAEARLAAQDGLTSSDPFQIERALNALCAIEFEAGNDTKSYDACKKAVDHSRNAQRAPTSVDLSNHAEAARSLFHFDEAERLLVEATQADASWYGNPWLDLADLYMRESRFAEALAALRRVPQHRAARPPHVQDSDRNESRRSLTAFLLLMGRPDEALRITDKALVLPDRRSHNSRDPAQDRSIVALLDRRARLMAADMLLEQSVAQPFYARWWAHLRATTLRFQGWMSGRQAARFLADEERLVGTFAIGTARSAVMPPWFLGDLVAVLGEGVVREAVARAQASDPREGANAYYAAIKAEAALADRDYDGAFRNGKVALDGLGPGEALLRARVQALLAETYRRNDTPTGFYDDVLQKDPCAFRRLGLRVPVRFQAGDLEIDRRISKALERSPRFIEADDALTVQVTGGRACLIGVSGAAWGCSAPPEDAENADEHVQAVADSFHEVVFAPRVDLSQVDINSLDGSNRVSRSPLKTLLN